METDLIINEIFEGKTIRAINHDGQVWLPVIDLADAWGVDRTTPYNLIKRNEDVFKGLFATLPIASDVDTMSTTTHDEKITYLCINERGLYLLMGKISASRLKNADAKKGVIRFQQWYPKLIETFRKGELKPIGMQTGSIPKEIEENLRHHLTLVDMLVQYAHVERGIATTVAVAKVEIENNVDLSWFKALIRKDTELAPGFLNATQLGKELGGSSPIVVNNMLASLGLQKYIGNKWEPTSTGKSYGENIPFTTIHETGTMHSGYQLKWRAETIDVLKEYLSKIEKQKQLQIAK